jgi:hypothetical protein
MSPEENYEDEDCDDGPSDREWESILAAGQIDLVKRAASRAGILNHEDAIDCTIFRFGTKEEPNAWTELCDGKVVFIGKHKVPDSLDDEEFEELYGGIDVELLVDAWLECLQTEEELNGPPEPSDMVSIEPGMGIALPYQLIDYVETEEGRRCIMLNRIDESDLAVS